VAGITSRITDVPRVTSVISDAPVTLSRALSAALGISPSVALSLAVESIYNWQELAAGPNVSPAAAAQLTVARQLAAGLGISPAVVEALVNPLALAAAPAIAPAVAAVLTNPKALAAAVGITPDAALSLANARELAAALGISPAVEMALSMPTTPLIIYGADLYQWLRGDNVTLNGSTVSAWQDLSGKGNNAIQGTTSAQPAYTASDATLNNQPTVTGDGANDVLTTAGLTTDLATDDFYIGGIFKQITWANGDQLSAGPGLPPRLQQGGGTPTMSLGSTSSVNQNTSAPLGTWVRGEAFFTLTAGASYLKLGNNQISGGNPGPGTRTSSSLFALATSLFGNFALAEFFVVKRAAGSGAPTPGERSAINAYLQGRYPSASF
jgi:hypothetical protein